MTADTIHCISNLLEDAHKKYYDEYMELERKIMIAIHDKAHYPEQQQSELDVKIKQMVITQREVSAKKEYYSKILDDFNKHDWR